MAILIYSLCTLTSLLCTTLLLRGYFKSRYRLLLWSGLSFCGITVGNLFVILDKVIFPEPEIDLLTPRLCIALLALLPLLYGFIFDE